MAVAAIVIAAGGGGLLGPLGALVTGDHERSAVTPARGFGDAAGPRLAAIVAAPSSAERARDVRGERPAGGAPGGRGRSPGSPPGSAPAPEPPGGGAPAPPTPPGAPAPSVPPAPPPPGGGQETAADRLDATVDEIRGQAPEEVQPALEPVGELTDALKDTCRQLPVCP